MYVVFGAGHLLNRLHALCPVKHCQVRRLSASSGASGVLLNRSQFVLVSVSSPRLAGSADIRGANGVSVNRHQCVLVSGISSPRLAGSADIRAANGILMNRHQFVLVSYISSPRLAGSADTRGGGDDPVQLHYFANKQQCIEASLVLQSSTTTDMP